MDAGSEQAEFHGFPAGCRNGHIGTLRICVYVYVYVCTCKFTYVDIHTYIYIDIDVYIYIYVCVRTVADIKSIRCHLKLVKTPQEVKVKQIQVQSVLGFERWHGRPNC